MGRLLFRGIYPGLLVVPYTRMTQRGLRSPRAQKYLASQDHMGWLFQETAKKAGVTAPMHGPIAISFACHYPDRQRRDASNVLKAIEDALVSAGVLAGDHWEVLPIIERCIVRGGRGRTELILELRAVEDEELEAA